MADRFPAEIWIGGSISSKARLYPDDPDDPTTVLEGLVGCLHDDGASHEFGEPPIPEDKGVSVLLGYANTNGHLHFCNAEACNGEFEQTEEFCVEHNIPFTRKSNCNGVYDAETAYFRQGMKQPRVEVCDVDGREIVCVEDVREVRKGIEKWLSGKDMKEFAHDLEIAVARLRKLCPDPVPELDKFEITH